MLASGFAITCRVTTSNSSTAQHHHPHRPNALSWRVPPSSLGCLTRSCGEQQRMGRRSPDASNTGCPSERRCVNTNWVTRVQGASTLGGRVGRNRCMQRNGVVPAPGPLAGAASLQNCCQRVQDTCRPTLCKAQHAAASPRQHPPGQLFREVRRPPRAQGQHEREGCEACSAAGLQQGCVRCCCGF